MTNDIFIIHNNQKFYKNQSCRVGSICKIKPHILFHRDVIVGSVFPGPILVAETRRGGKDENKPLDWLGLIPFNVLPLVYDRDEL